MGIQFHEFRKKKPWVVTWRNPWTGKKHTQGFDDEATAVAFEAAQAEIAAKERALLRKARKQKASQSRISVKDLLESYFRLAHSNPVTIRQARYHASHIVSAFGHRLASQLNRQDILNFSEAQHLRGIAPITVTRRVSILRAALNWGTKNGLLPENPLFDLRLPRARARRIAPPTAKEARALLRQPRRMCSASSFWGYVPGRVSAPANYSVWSGKTLIWLMPCYACSALKKTIWRTDATFRSAPI